MVVRRGDIYWVDFSPGKGSEPLGRRPGLVVQCDALNDSKLNTVVVPAITSNLKFGELPGNELLEIVKEMGEEDITVAVTKNGVPVSVLMSADRYEGLLETIEILADRTVIKALARASRESGKSCLPAILSGVAWPKTEVFRATEGYPV